MTVASLWCSLVESIQIQLAERRCKSFAYSSVLRDLSPGRPTFCVALSHVDLGEVVALIRPLFKQIIPQKNCIYANLVLPHQIYLQAVPLLLRLRMLIPQVST